MAKNLKYCCFTQCLFFLLLTCIAVTVANSARPELPHKTNQHSPSHRPQPHDFPNDQLYRAYIVIQHFKNTITCDSKNITTTWTGHDICGKRNYRGFYCAIPRRRAANLTVTSINFDGFGLCAPKLRGFVDQLPDLALFQAAYNNFGGDVPRLAGPTYLYNTDANSDGEGTADISGSVAAQVPPLVAANVKAGVMVNNNQLSGPLPADLGFSKMSYLAFANNMLTGPIPPSIAHARDTLREVLFQNNQLSGCLPHELGLLSNATMVDAGMNKLTGPIPASFSCLSSVEQLNLAGNLLHGEVPDALCHLAGPAGRLANLSLSSNYFTSVGPACWALIKNGVLDVANNCIPGYPRQRLPEECASFLSRPKMCPASTDVPCRGRDNGAAGGGTKNVAASEGGRGRAYSSYVTYATLHA